MFITLGLSFWKVGPGIFRTTMRRRILRAFISEFLTQRGIALSSHPPYSHDLVPVDFIYALN